MDLQLAGDVVVVIGGAGGIGGAIAAEFAAEGAHVSLVDRVPHVETKGQQLADKYGVRVRAFMCDATDANALSVVAATTVRDLGRCDHLVYAAGAGSGKFGFPFWNLEPDDWPQVLDVNLTGAVRAAHVFQAPLVAQHRGTMLFISSVAAQIGSQTDPPYSAAKAGLINFAMCAARDLAPHNVRVNTLCPGMVKTNLNRSVWQAWHDRAPADKRQTYEEWAAEKVNRVSPLGRWQSCEDVAAMAVFLASRRADNITGQTINIDGGWVMHW